MKTPLGLLKSNKFAVIWLTGLVALTSTAVVADEEYESWRNEKIADALTAAPPYITDTATIYAWDKEGKMQLLRLGIGSFNCVASGAFSTRIGLPDSPFPDPMCMDEHAWAFFKAVWSEKNPMKPEKPYPKVPGVVWMLAGMGVPDGMVRQGADADAQFEVDTQGKKVARLSPHIMLMPLPVNGKDSTLPTHYDPDNPTASWVMAADTPIEHVMIHFSDEDVSEMMNED